MQLDAYLKSAGFKCPPLELKFGDGTDIPETVGGKPLPRRIQILKAGNFTDPRYGDFAITPEMLLSFKKNFDAKVLKIDLALDFAHNSDLEAGAWFTSLELSDDNQTLWGIVDWTKLGEEKVRGKEFRYISADITSNYIDNETKQEFGPTLKGAGLTNRPVIKGMEPIFHLSEKKDVSGDLDLAGGELQTVVVSKEKAKSVDEAKKIATDVGAKSTDSVDETIDSFRFRQRDPNDFNDDSFKSKGIPDKGATLVYGHLKGQKLSDQNKGDKSMDPKDKEIADLKAKIAAMGKEEGAEGEKPAAPAAGSDAEKMAAMKKQLDEYAAKCAQYEEKEKAMLQEKAMSEKKVAFEKLLTEGKAVKAQEKAFMEMDIKLSEELFKNAKPVALNLNSRGHGGESKDESTDVSVEEQIKVLADKKVTDKSAKDLGSAMSMVLRENPELRKAYHARNSVI